MRRLKRLGALLIVLVMVFTMIPFTTAGAADLSGKIVLKMGSTKFTVNGVSTEIDAQGSKPVQEKGYTMLPLRAVLEATGGTLDYDAATNRITIKRGGDTVVLTLENNSATVNGESRRLGAAPYAKNSRTYVHIRTLELFGMKVDWDEKSGDVTVTYVEPTKIFNLKLQNGMGTPYTSVQIAPMASLAGEPEWSGNLLGADTLFANGNLVVQAPLTGTGYYQLRCGYASTGNTAYHTINNINLTGIKESATILMNSATAPKVTLDGASATSSTIQLYIVNNTGRTLNALYCKKTSDTYYDQNNNLLQNQVLVNGGQTTVSFQYDSASPYYNFYARDNSGLFLDEFKNVQISAGNSLAGQQFATLTLSASGAVGNYNGSGSQSTATNQGDTQVRFTNDTDDTIYELRASTTNRTSSVRNGDVIWSDSNGLKSGRSVDFYMDIGSKSEWYFGAVTSRNSASASISYMGLVDFKKTSCTYARVTLTDGNEYELQDWDDCDACGTDDYDYDDDYDDHKTLFDDAKAKHKELDDTIDEDDYDDLSKSDRKHYVSKSNSSGAFKTSDHKYNGNSSSSDKNTSSGDVDLVVLNTMSDDIEAIFAINKDDYDSDMEKYDYGDVEDDNDFIDLLGSHSVDSNEAVIVQDGLEANEDYYFAVFTSDKSSADPINTIKNFRISVDRDADYAVLNITGKSSSTTFDSEDEKYLVWIVNESSSTEKITFDCKKSSKGDTSVTLNKRSITTKVLDAGEYGEDWEIDTNEDYEDLDLSDFDYGVVWLTIESDGDIYLRDID